MHETLMRFFSSVPRRAVTVMSFIAACIRPEQEYFFVGFWTLGEVQSCFDVSLRDERNGVSDRSAPHTRIPVHERIVASSEILQALDPLGRA